MPLMVNDFSFLECGSGDGFSAIRLIYGDRRPAGMLIIMPDENQFDTIEAQFDRMLFQETQNGLIRTNVITFTMPKFEFGSNFDLTETLFNMGMRSVFNSSADFSGLSSQSLSVGYIGHSATISVDERGTEATGVTSVMMPLSAIFTECETEIIADRPFMFTIFDFQTQTILFLGRVMNPAE